MGRVQLSSFSQDSLCAAAQRIMILRSIFCHSRWPFRVSTYDRILPGLNDEATDGFGAFCGTFSFVFRLIYMAAAPRHRHACALRAGLCQRARSRRACKEFLTQRSCTPVPSTAMAFSTLTNPFTMAELTFPQRTRQLPGKQATAAPPGIFAVPATACPAA